MKTIVLLLLACVIGGVAAGRAAATGHKPKRKVSVKFDQRFDCAKIAPAALLTSLAGGYGGTIAPAALLTSLAGGYGGTYTLKAPTKVDKVVNNGPKATGGFSHCDYAQSAGYPWAAKAEGPGEVTVVYGTDAIDFFKRDHAAAVQGVRCTKLKAANPNAVVDPRQCGPVAVTGIGTQAYEAASYIAVLRGKTFIAVALSSVPDANGQPTLVPADLLESIATALLARMPNE
jgi:hypothetical protein